MVSDGNKKKAAVVIAALAIGAAAVTYVVTRPGQPETVPEPLPVASPAPSHAPSPEPTPEPSPEPTPKVLLQSVADLRAEYGNEDIIGFIEIEGTNIAYPVVQSADNNYYLNRDIDGNNSQYGTIYMDYENDPAELSYNTVIYGHNMRNGSMFHNLRYYKDKSYFDEHPVIRLTLPYEETEWEIFAFYQTTTDFYYIQTEFKDDNAFEELLSQMREKARYDTGVAVTADDKILTLSTCASEGGDNRYVLNARLASQ